MARTRRHFTKQFKAEAVATAALDGPQKAANSFQVQPGQIAKWSKEMSTDQPQNALSTKTRRRVVAVGAAKKITSLDDLRRLRDILDMLLSI